MLGYRHNHTAGTLRRANGLSHSIGLIFEDVGNPFFAAIHRGVEEVARDAVGGDLRRQLGRRPGARARAGRGRARAPRRRPDPRPDRARPHATCCATSRPASGSCSSTARRETIDADCVLSDNRGGARRGGRALLAHGHARIAFVGPPPNGLYTAAERLAGYREALAGGIAAESSPRRRRAAARPRPDRPTALFTRPEPGHDRGPARAAPARAAAPDRARRLRRHRARGLDRAGA